MRGNLGVRGGGGTEISAEEIPLRPVKEIPEIPIAKLSRGET